MKRFVVAIGIALLAHAACGSARGCANRSRPFITIVEENYWSPATVQRVEISDDGAIAIGPFEQSCARCATLEPRELRALEDRLGKPEMQAELANVPNRGCGFDAHTLFLSIGTGSYAFCYEELTSFPRLARLIKDVESIVARHFSPLPKRQFYSKDRSCQSLRAIARRTWECREVFPWKPPRPDRETHIDRSAVRMSLEVEPKETLPGIPITMRFAMTNSGQQPVTIPLAVGLEVTPERGEPFFALASAFADSAGYTTWLSHQPVLGRDETASFDWDAEWHWNDGRGFPGLWCLEPGRYHLRLIADESFKDGRLSERPLTLQEPWLVGPVVSNEIELTIVNPKDIDAKAWRLARERGATWGASPFPELWQRYPTSAYAAYGAPIPLNEQKDYPRIIEVLGTALQRNPRGAIADGYRYRIAEARIARARCFARINERARAREESAAARQLLEAIGKRSSYAALASDQLGTIYRMPEGLADSAGWTVSTIPWLRKELDKENLVSSAERLDEFLSAVDAVPPDGRHAFSLLVDAIRELDQASSPQHDRWMDMLLDRAVWFGHFILGWANASIRPDGQLTPAEAALRKSTELRYAKRLDEAFSELQKALAAMEPLPQPTCERP